METQTGVDTIEGVLCVWHLLRNGLGNKNGSNKRRRCQKSMDKTDFVTFTMMSVKHSVAHRTMLGERVKPNEERINQENWVRLIHQFTHAQEGTGVQMWR